MKTRIANKIYRNCFSVKARTDIRYTRQQMWAAYKKGCYGVDWRAIEHYRQLGRFDPLFIKDEIFGRPKPTNIPDKAHHRVSPGKI